MSDQDRAPPQPQAAPDGDGFGAIRMTWTIGLLVVLLALIALSLVVIQYQVRVRDALAKTDAASIGFLTEDLLAVSAIYDRSAAINREIADARKIRADSFANLGQSQTKRDNLLSRLLADLNDTIARIGVINMQVGGDGDAAIARFYTQLKLTLCPVANAGRAATAKLDCGNGDVLAEWRIALKSVPNEDLRSVIDQVALLADAAVSAPAPRAPHLDQLAKLQPAAEAMLLLHEELIEQDDAADGHMAVLERQDSHIGALTDELKGLDDWKDNDRMKESAYRAAVYDIYALANIPIIGYPARILFGIPSIVLKLVLCLLMGVMGSAVAILRDRVFGEAKSGLTQDQIRDRSHMIFRLVIGGFIAFCVFFFANVGFLTLSDQPRDQFGEIQISIFLVGFLSIISGFMSRSVAEWMETQANAFLAAESPEHRSRWAVGLADALKERAVTPEKMATLLPLTAADVERLARLEVMAAYDRQTLIAAVLQKPISRIFSDIRT